MSDDVMERIEEIVDNKPAGRVFTRLIELTLIRFLGPEIFSLVYIKLTTVFKLPLILHDYFFSSECRTVCQIYTSSRGHYEFLTNIQVY
jgi:hypothetical protein